ncbi:hypothetical protein LNO55_27295 [Klebsiella pneumoniae subsp. pneumoniae]|nr:hypothetical protein [Klebsiella pneumoniae subsp. pneumoniae]
MHKIFYTLQDNVMDSLGFPASLRRQINNGVLQANKPDRQDTIWLRSVVAWHSWLSYEQHCIRYLRPGHDGDYEFFERHIPQLDYLIQTTVTENFRCDITAIAGMGCSRDSDREFSSIQDFAMKKCQALTKPPSAERLAQILQHHGLRLSEMYFSEFSWVPGRLYWQNVDGSHHMAAARFMAIQLGQPVPLSGQLTSYQLNSSFSVSYWTNGIYSSYPRVWSMGSSGMHCCVFNARLVFPPPGWENGAERQFNIIWLERHQTVPARVSRTLAKAGFPSVGQLLLKQGV